MRDFANTPGRLRVLPPEARILYTAFVVATLVGLWVSWRLYHAAVGAEGPAAYYAVPETTAGTSETESTAPGPALELPEEASRPRVIRERVSERKLLEVTHFHLFSVPVVVLVLAHLWLLAALPRWLHVGGIAVAVLAAGTHIAAPWLVRDREAIAPLVPISAATMLVVLAILAIVPAVDMWLPARPRGG